MLRQSKLLIAAMVLSLLGTAAGCGPWLLLTCAFGRELLRMSPTGTATSRLLMTDASLPGHPNVHLKKGTTLVMAFAVR